MKHYKDPETNEIYAYNSDGSQDAFIKPKFIPVTDAEAIQIANQKTETLTNEKLALNVDPVEKLKIFLVANPDVAKLLN